MKPKITESDLCRAAKRLRTSTAEVETVAEVESAGNAFYADGFPVILFERHKFHKYTKGKFAKDHPRISQVKGGGYSPPKGPEPLAVRNERWQRSKFSEAFGLDPEAAMKSCSWGRFQIMGFNYEVCGFNSVGEFVDAMKESEGRQLDAFVEFVIHNGLGDELRNHEWKDFARGYNGANYRQNKYDEKLKDAYTKFSKRKIHCGQVSARNSQLPSVTSNHPSVDSGKPSDTSAPDWTEGERPLEPPETDSGAAPGATTVDSQMSPQVLDRERPSLFTRVMTAVFVAIGTAIASITSTCGGSEIANMAARQGAQKVIENADRSDLQTFGIVVAYVALGLGSAVLLFWIAAKIWEKSSERANRLNMQKAEFAANKEGNTVEFKR